MKDLYQTNPELLKDLTMFLPFLRQEDTIHDHFKMDENAAMYGFTVLSESSDPILKDLSRRMLNRDLFEYETIQDQLDLDNIKDRVRALGYDPEYYVVHDEAKQSPYKPYKGEEGHNIWILKNDGSIHELSCISNIVSAIVRGNQKEDKKAFFPVK